MFKIRTTKTSSGKTAVQVVSRRYHQTKIVKHVGSGETLAEITQLKTLANQFVREKQGLIPLFDVGARLSNLKPDFVQKISLEINGVAGKYFKTKMRQNGLGYLICDFSPLRALKDKSDRKKQLIKAQNQINNPAKFLKRSRFVTEETKSVYRLNEQLIQQDEFLDGIKGYYTNLENLDSHLIVSRYHDLWKIEKAFRIAKSDLLARPIFHRKKESIEAHVLIVFLALCVAKSIEFKTGMSVGKIKEKIWKVLDVEFKDKLTGKTFIRQTPVPILEY